MIPQANRGGQNKNESLNQKTSPLVQPRVLRDLASANHSPLSPHRSPLLSSCSKPHHLLCAPQTKLFLTPGPLHVLVSPPRMLSARLNPIHLSRLSLNVLHSLCGLPVLVSPLGAFITISDFAFNQYLQLKIGLLCLSTLWTSAVPVLFTSLSPRAWHRASAQTNESFMGTRT